MTTLLFIYGSLLPGQPSHALLALARRVGDARTAARYALYDLGEYPAMVEDGATSISGELYEVDERLLAELDEFEGHPTFYCRVHIALEDGRAAEAYVLGRSRVEGRAVIDSGDWRNRSEG